MKDYISKRVLDETFDIINTKDTIRAIAKKHGVSKSTVHKDFSERLKILDKVLYEYVAIILNEHLKTRHLRGGESTRRKYLSLRN